MCRALTQGRSPIIGPLWVVALAFPWRPLAPETGVRAPQKKEPRYPRGGRPRLQSLDAVITQGTCSGRKSRGQYAHAHHPKRNVADHQACATAKTSAVAGQMRSFDVKGSSDCVAPA